MNPEFAEIGQQFVAAYYKGFDDKNSRATLQPLYHSTALLTFEGCQFQGPQAIVEKLMSVPSDNIQRAITCADYQPTIDGGVQVCIIGQLKTDSEHDKPMPFTHVFLLKRENANYFINNEIFRLALHNF
ncbi:hypothetical protein SNE40_013272 [Patella caerulea]|uniref:Nuclear transport factor 2 n=1 Tax=Patella caerulea TaxID=87958 RepID=A0AAN8JHV6_PATCE